MVTWVHAIHMLGFKNILFAVWISFSLMVALR